MGGENDPNAPGTESLCCVHTCLLTCAQRVGDLSSLISKTIQSVEAQGGR